MNATTAVRVYQAASGYVVTIDGPATMRESFALRGFFQQGDAELGRIVDLRNCSLVDSTFAGLLVKWKKDLSEQTFLIVADEAKARELFGAMSLDSFFEFICDDPQCVGEGVPLDVSRSTSPRFAEHVLECHDRLAQIEGPQQAIFSKVADRLEDELRG